VVMTPELRLLLWALVGSAVLLAWLASCAI
jgi:hypothetical protein